MVKGCGIEIALVYIWKMTEERNTWKMFEMDIFFRFAFFSLTIWYSPLTTNRTGWLVKASCVVKSLDVTWHSQRPSSKSMVADRTHSEQSPPMCGDWSPCNWMFEPAHSYFLAKIPTGCEKDIILYFYKYFVVKKKEEKQPQAYMQIYVNTEILFGEK